ncbi:hypothetical protein FALBO_8469 [Fusarium albosuccineum]|uniref:Uncharacterized protein n=1 Tax=Fusarium albosuccineum TaxID=1237068 RepID=A0A8H4P6X1_9HYPO|nr:hypothetical protein FALBO_8469 [Fusarium albosuccineum]
MRFDMLFCIALGASVAAESTSTAKAAPTCSLQTFCGGANGGCPAQAVSVLIRSGSVSELANREVDAWIASVIAIDETVVQERRYLDEGL